MRSHLNVKASLFTLILAFIAIGTVAIGAVMNSNKAVKEVEETSVTTTTWYFTGTSISEVFTASKWQNTDPMNTSCTDEPRPLPCVYEVSDQNIADPIELVAYLETKHHDDPTDVALAAASRKPEQ